MSQAKPKHGLKWIGGVFLAVLLIVVIAAWYILPLGPLFDDGPFHGSPTSAINGRQPDQSMPIWGGSTLEVFDSTAEGVSATVQLRSTDGAVQWAILADGHKPGDVRSVRFSNAHRSFVRSGTVHGVVDWTFGREACYWFITGNGKLRDYWYSW